MYTNKSWCDKRYLLFEIWKAIFSEVTCENLSSWGGLYTVVLCHNFSKQLLYRKRSPSLATFFDMEVQPATNFFWGSAYEFIRFIVRIYHHPKATPPFFEKFHHLESILELEKYGSLIGWNRKPTIFIIQKEAAGKQAALSLPKNYGTSYVCHVPCFDKMLAVPTKPGKPMLFNGFRLPRCGCCVPPCNHCPVWASQFSWHQKLGFCVFFFATFSLFSLSLGGKNVARLVFWVMILEDWMIRLAFGAFSQSWGKGFTLEGGANTLL